MSKAKTKLDLNILKACRSFRLYAELPTVSESLKDYFSLTSRQISPHQHNVPLCFWHTCEIKRRAEREQRDAAKHVMDNWTQLKRTHTGLEGPHVAKGW